MNKKIKNKNSLRYLKICTLSLKVIFNTSSKEKNKNPLIILKFYFILPFFTLIYHFLPLKIEFFTIFYHFLPNLNFGKKN